MSLRPYLTSTLRGGILALLVLGCAPLNPAPESTNSSSQVPPLMKPEQPRPALAHSADSQKFHAAIAALNDYSAKLGSSLAKNTEGNLVVSPLGPFVLSQILYEGSQGGTRKELEQLLSRSTYGFAEVSQLHWKLSSGDGLLLENGLFVDQGIGFQTSLAEKLTLSLAATAETLPFATDPDGSSRHLNAWVEKATQGRYSDLAQPPVSETLMVMISTLVFQSRWYTPFPPEDTKPRPFKLRNGSTIQVPTMERHESHSIGIVSGSSGEGVVLDFREGFELLVLLPQPGVTPAQLLKETSFQRVQSSSPVTLYLPRFAFEAPMMELQKSLVSPNDLKPLLQRPGSQAIALSTLQRAKIRVDEKGAEAAAVTEMAATPAAAMTPTPPKVFRFDRPFAFILRDSETQAVILLGKVESPGVGASTNTANP